MKDLSKSSLLMKHGRLVGFGYDKHPLNRKAWVHIVFYWIQPDEYVICISEGTGKKRPDLMRPHLGEMVSGPEFAPYAQRGLQGVKTFGEFKNIITEGFKNIKFEWWEEKNES